MLRGRSSKLVWIALAVLAILVGALAAAYRWRLEVATGAILHLLEERGVASPQLRVTELSASGVTIRDLRLGEPVEFEAAQVRAEYGWRNEPAGVRAVAVDGARGSLDLREDAAIFGALQQPLNSLLASSEPVSGRAPSLPAVRVKNSTLRLHTTEGSHTLLVDFELAAAEDGSMEGGVQLATNDAEWNGIRLRHASASLPLRIQLGPTATTIEWKSGTLAFDDLLVEPVTLAGRTNVVFSKGRATFGGASEVAEPFTFTSEVAIPSLRIPATDGVPELAIEGLTGVASLRGAGGARNASMGGSVTLRGDAIELAAHQIALREVELHLPLPLSSAPLRLSKAVLSDLETASRFPATELSATLTLAEGGADWQVDGAANALSGALNATIGGTLGAAGDAGNLRIAFDTLRFDPDGLQPESFHPGLGVLRDVDGSLEAVGRIAWTGKGLTTSGATIRVSKLDFQGPTARVEALTGSLALTSLLPPSSAPHQELDANALHTGGVRFDDARVRYQVLPGAGTSGPGLHLEEASLRLGHGSLRIVDTLLDPAKPREFALRADGLRLEELAHLLDVAEIAGTGTISGVIPVKIEDELVQIREGVLRSEGPGVLNIRADFARKALESAGETAAQVGRALEDFHYERLRITIEKPFRGTTLLGIHVLGGNPKVLAGQPFDLHINIETDLEPLLRAASLGLRLPTEWSRRNSSRRQ